MPLPQSGKTVWPPESMSKAYGMYHTCSVWYAGDPDELSKLYGSSGSFDSVDSRYQASVFHRAASRVWRWFWGQPVPAGERNTKLHLPIASDVATMSADLLFAEPPVITVEDDVLQGRLDEITSGFGLQASLIEGAEVSAALGDVYLVGTWDAELRGYPWLRVVHADAVVPEWRGNVLSAATVWSIVGDSNGVVYRHLERHEPGVILNGLYKGDSVHLGVRVDLGEHPDTERLTEQVATGIDVLTVAHVPNMRPNRLDRGSPLGRSDFSPGAIGLMDQLDETWSCLAREYRLAKARAMVTADAMESRGRGKGATVQLDKEIFVPLNVPPMERPSDPVKLIQPLIRVEEHLAGARAIIEQIVRSCGYSMQSFGEKSEVAVTATEIQQRERLSYLTRGKKTLYWGVLADALEMLMLLDVSVFGTRVTPERPSVEFGDTVVESTSTTAQTLTLLTSAEAASTKTKVALLHPEWDEDEIREETSRILVESGRVVPGPDSGVQLVDESMSGSVE